jgi:hypothetical protein
LFYSSGKGKNDDQTTKSGREAQPREGAAKMEADVAPRPCHGNAQQAAASSQKKVG